MRELTYVETEKPLIQMKKGRALREVDITKEIIAMRGTTTLEAFKIRLNKCLQDE